MKKQITASGQLAHHFWGDYCADIVLSFPTPWDCAEALKALQPDNAGTVARPSGGSVEGIGWQILEKAPHAAFIRCSGATLDQVTDRLVEYGADRKKIASLAKSVDRGEPFSITMLIEDTDPAQLQLIQ